MSHHSKQDIAVSASGQPAASAPTAPEQSKSETAPPAPIASPAPADKPKTVTIEEAELQKLKAEAAKAAENWDKFLRAAADLENYRKRVAREREELTRAARETVIAALLPALDNLERALQHSSENSPLREGLLQVRKQFERALGEFGLVEISAQAGDTFDPSLHEAISHVESNDHADGIILQQVQSGYKLGDRLLRAARVVVSKGKSHEADAGNPPAPEKKSSWFKSPFSK